MMNKNKHYFSLFILAIFAFGWTTCTNKKDICTTCEAVKGIEIPLKLNLLSSSPLTVSAKYWQALKEKDYPEFFIGSIPNKEENLQFCIEYVKHKNIITQNNQSVAYLAFYIDNALNQAHTISDQNIQGISIYFLNDGQYHHQLYIRKENAFEELTQERFATQFVSFGVFNKILNKKIPKELKGKSYVTVSGKLHTKFSTKMLEIAEKYKDPKGNKYHKSSADCDAPCFTGGNGACQDANGTRYCKNESSGGGTGTCFASGASSILTSENYAREAAYIDSDLMYNFRDNFLNNNNLRKEYTQMYYDLSDFLSDKTTLSLALKTAIALYDCNSIMTKLLDPITYGNDVAITAAQKTTLLNLINEYKVVSTDQNYQGKLTRIENDLNTYAGLTVSNLITQFQ